jgi:hypothetical protein
MTRYQTKLEDLILMTMGRSEALDPPEARQS